MDAVLIITLPLPARGLSPNARGHWRQRHRLTKQARNVAKLRTLEAIEGKNPPEVSKYLLRFYFPDARRRDDDNAAASCKAYRDGIADALRMDDSGLRMMREPAMLTDSQSPRLEVYLYGAAHASEEGANNKPEKA